MGTTIHLRKVFFKWHSTLEPLPVPSPVSPISECVLGWVQHDCENQVFDKLEGNEQIILTIERIPFIHFRIMLSPEGKYHLSSNSPISLQTYQEQSYRVERWGDYDDIGGCVNKAISIVAGFTNRMGKEDFNDGNYYKDEVSLTNA